MGTECSSERIQAVNSGIHEVLKILPVSIYTGEIRDALFYTLLLANSYKKLLPIRSSHLPKSQRRLKKFSVSTDENIIPLKIDETHFVIPGIEDSIEKTRNELDKILLNMHNAFRDRGRADINQRTTLHFAAYWGSPVCVQTLILEKADVDAQDKYGLNPAMWACQADRLDNLLLLEQKTRTKGGLPVPFSEDHNGFCVLHHALLSKGGASCLEYLLKTYGASSVDKNGQTALHHASALGLLASCKVITKNSNGSIVNAVDRYSRTALHLATMAGHGDIVQLLLDNRAKPEICDCQGFSAMHYARTKRLHFCMLVFAKYRRKMVHREVMNPTQTGLNWSQRGLHLIDNECLTARPRYPTDSDTSSSTNVFEEDCSVGKRPPTPEPQNSQLRNVNTNKDKNTAANTRSFNFDNVMSTKCTTYSSVKNLLENRKITNSNSKSESVAKEPKRECQKIKPLPNLKCKASDISSRTLGYKSQVNPAVTIVQAPDLSRNDNGQRSSVSDDDIRSLKEVKLLAPRPNYYLNFPSDNTKVPTRQTIRVNECQGKSSLNSDVSDVESSCRATVPKIIWARNPPCSAKISLSDRTQENTLTPKLRMEDGFPSRYGKLDYQMQGRTTPSRPSPGDSSVSDVELASVTIPTPPRTENNGCLEKHSKDLRTEVLGNLMQPSRKDANSSETPRLLKRSQIKWTMSSMKRLFSSERNTDGQNSVAKSPSRVSGIDCQQAQKEARKQNEPDDHQGNKQTDGKRQQSELMNKPLHRCEIGHFKHPILSPSFSWFTGKNPATQIIETKNSSCANVSENLPRKNMIRRH